MFINQKIKYNKNEFDFLYFCEGIPPIPTRLTLADTSPAYQIMAKLTAKAAYALISKIDTGGASVYTAKGFVYLDEDAVKDLRDNVKKGKYAQTSTLTTDDGTKPVSVQEDINWKEPVGILTNVVTEGQVIEIDGKKIRMPVGRAKLIFGNCPSGTPEMTEAIVTEIITLQNKVKATKAAHAGENGYVGGPEANPVWIALVA